MRTWTKRQRRAMAIGERALTARTAAPSRPATPERRCARLRLEDDADRREEVEAAPPRAVAALTDIFRVVRWDSLRSATHGKGRELSFEEKTREAKRAKHVKT